MLLYTTSGSGAMALMAFKGWMGGAQRGAVSVGSYKTYGSYLRLTPDSNVVAVLTISFVEITIRRNGHPGSMLSGHVGYMVLAGLGAWQPAKVPRRSVPDYAEELPQ
jgi:hypothetical protein